MKTLQTKITLIVSIILIGIMGLLTAYTMVNINNSFVRPIQEAAPANTTIQAPDQSTNAAPYGKTVVFDAAQAQQRFFILQVSVMLSIALLGILLTYYLVGKSLLPLKKLNEATAQIDAQKLKTQITVPPSRDEIATLAASFNSMLERLDHAFTAQKNFAQNAAHELKTPLSVIKSSLQVLALDDTPSLEDYQETTQLIEKSTEELIQIVAQLLELTHQSAVAQQAVSLTCIIHTCLEEQEEALSEKHIALHLKLDEVTLYASAPLVKSVVSNLLSNAIKYNKTNGSISIYTVTTGTHVQLVFRDTGIGMDHKDLDCIFEPFFRADPSRSKQIPGNGLGLSIVKMAVETLQGTIQVTSRLQEGTTFTVTLPLSQSREKGDPTPSG